MTLVIDHEMIKAHIWDTSGQERCIYFLTEFLTRTKDTEGGRHYISALHSFQFAEYCHYSQV
ncbi:hypothetical protein RJ639_027480 [Escallonia herrerae]|uniref:Uncharacterized protein n=1 Tax=Escallonia herrerae TaxID=1293975 RepID=A0AA88XB47_9ASTE|nr:hypothetical protein RJ639_027480 [Escallonia herrerae]